MPNNSQSEFHKLDIESRLNLIVEGSNLSDSEGRLLKKLMRIAEQADVNWVENQISAYVLPLSVGTGFIINGKDRLVPMVTEEVGIVAGSSFAAKAVARTGGFNSKLLRDWVLGHIICNFGGHLHEIVDKLESEKESLIESVNLIHPNLGKVGGGLRDVALFCVKTPEGKEYLKIDLVADCADAMGAGTITTMAEELASKIENLADCKSLIRVISNDSIGRLCKCTAEVNPEDIGGNRVAEAIVEASEYARSDPQRAVTHNKGILNGMISFATATGNDTRAVEAGAHYFAATAGVYQPLSTWTMENGSLKGYMEVPVPLGSVGGATRKSKISKLCYKILGTDSGIEIREICAAVGLAANLGVLRALVTKGIGRAHKS